jgi:hypothetical protein
MRVRREERELDINGNGAGKCIVAHLVADKDAPGAAGQEIVATLGSIQPRFLNINVKCTREFHQGLFWQVVDRELDRLDLHPETKGTIETALAERVPRPGDEWALWGVTCIPKYNT